MGRRLPAGVTVLRSGRYAVRPYDRTAGKKGKQHTFDTLSEAVAFKEQVAAGQIDPASRTYTCDEWVEHWTSEAGYQRRKASTNLHNAERVKKFAEDFEGVPLANITPSMARKWAFKDGENNTARVAAVRAMLNDAVRDQILDRNPFTEIRVDKGPGRKFIQPLTEKELAGLAKTADEKWPDWPVLSAMITFAGYSGLRRGETLALRWTDIDWEKGTILVERQWMQKARTEGPPKNGMSRVVALLPQAQAALRRIDRHQSPDGRLIWHSPRGKRMDPALLDYYWRQTRERFLGTLTQDRIDAIDLEWHTLRHFCASYLVDKGIQAHDVANQLGHTDGGRLIQELYGHLYPDNSISRILSAAA